MTVRVAAGLLDDAAVACRCLWSITVTGYLRVLLCAFGIVMFWPNEDIRAFNNEDYKSMVDDAV